MALPDRGGVEPARRFRGLSMERSSPSAPRAEAIFQHPDSAAAASAGPQWMKEQMGVPVVRGEKRICLAISEPFAGSDVAALRTTARLSGAHAPPPPWLAGERPLPCRPAWRAW